MKNRIARALSFGALIIVGGCSSVVDPVDPSGGPGAGGSGPTGATTGAGQGTGGQGAGGSSNQGEWTSLITAEWGLEPGTELTNDLHQLMVDRDIYIGGIRPIGPTGTHHTVLAIGDLGAGNIIYASGLGTNAVMFPKGVGLKVSAGETLVLQLHLFNPTSDVLKGTSGIEIIEVKPEDLEQEADIILPGPIDFNIPPNAKYSHSGTCTVGATQNLFALFPHMHQLGSHLMTTLTIGGKESVIHDGDYSFDHQAFLSFEPITMNAGDTIKTECTWDNTTPQNVTWGESSTTEMCFSILYRYPAQQQGSFCTK